MRNTSNNPALTRIPAFANANKTVGFGPRPQTADPIEQGYFGPSATSRDTGRMTIEDVTVRTAMLLVTAIVTGAVTWTLDLYVLALPAMVVGLVLGLVISFKQITNPAAIITYAAVQGVVLGAISQVFEQRYPGIVVQAVIGTTGVAAGALFLYRSGRIRVTPKLTKMVFAGLIGFLSLAVVNLIASIFVSGGLGLRSGGPLAIVFSLFAIGLASFCLIIDFDYIENGVKAGLPERYGWYAAFSLMVTLIWLYIEILRLLSYFRSR
ncbi:MAG: conserved rane protein of unknown function [Frankiales bacterium]|nr:conserved rane protein of unknown function [Frankiales bacterium]